MNNILLSVFAVLIMGAVIFASPVFQGSALQRSSSGENIFASLDAEVATISFQLEGLQERVRSLRTRISGTEAPLSEDIPQARVRTLVGTSMEKSSMDGFVDTLCRGFRDRYCSSEYFLENDCPWYLSNATCVQKCLDDNYPKGAFQQCKKKLGEIIGELEME